jgi:hypothetical protein
VEKFAGLYTVPDLEKMGLWNQFSRRWILKILPMKFGRKLSFSLSLGLGVPKSFECAETLRVTVSESKSQQADGYVFK